MNRAAIIFVLMILTVCVSVSAQNIAIKNTVFSGWKYSVDGSEFKNVGASAKDLKVIMAGNESALEKLNAYSRNQTAVYTLAVIGVGTAICYETGVGGSESQKKNPILLYSSLGMCVVMLILESAANDHLKAAVGEHNGGTGSWSMNLGVVTQQGSRQLAFGPTFIYQF